MAGDGTAPRRGRLRDRLAPLGERLELGSIVLLLLLVSGVWGFIELAGEVVEGETERLDRALLLAFRTRDDPAEPLGPLWLQEMGRDLTALGGVAVLSLVTIGVLAFLAMRRLWAAAGLLLVAVLGGLAVSTLLKEYFERPRPDLVPHGSIVTDASFPSGHSMMATVVYLTLGALLARVEPELRVKVFVFGFALLLALLVGVSRVYLGVHWPTDVLAGWVLGAAWALLFWLIARWLQHRGRLEVDRGG
jgi:undecaprenyl-diphosphatase